MKTKKLILVVLFVVGLISASLSSVSGSAGNDFRHRKSGDTTDTNGGGCPIPPIGH